MNRLPINCLSMFVLAIVLVGCNSSDDRRPLSSGSFQTITGQDLRIVTGQVVYVPAYSEVFFGREGRNMKLAVTLAIHNTNLDKPIIIQSVRYYDTNGNIVRDYIDDPVEISPLATSGFFVEDSDTSGGLGANFVVEWGAEEPVSEPIIEAIMVGTQGTQGISMISLGRIISQIGETQIEE